jgi:hypothetical protein
MSPEFEIMIVAAITISCLHTLAGPDHYLPFIALARARGWSFPRTIFWTVLCGCGHVWSSVFLALIAASVGWSMAKLSWFDSFRGGLAGWALVLFGILYAAWGFWKLKRDSSHKHFDIGGDGKMYVCEHNHRNAVMPSERHAVTPWVMFLIFLLGPCEPMMALIFYPAAQQSFSGMLLLITVYTLFTLMTMVLMVMLGYYGLSLLNSRKLEKYMHPVGGLTIFICGAGMVFLEW